MKTKIINSPDMIKARDRSKGSTTFIMGKSEHLNELKALAKGKKYYIHTYGCQANVRDEETMRGILEYVGYERTEDISLADVAIINTCAVRENAEDKVYGEIGNLKKYRRINRDLVLGICGCMVEQPEILQVLLDKFPEVNLYFGTHEIYRLVDLIYEVKKTQNRVVAIESKKGEVIEEELPPVRNNQYKAFVNIIYGCDKFCTYCIVPYTRGKERSRHFIDIMNEVRDLKRLGYKEITFLGQNVNAYGKDLDEGYDFADVLEEAAKMGIPRIRFTTSHPWDFSSKMIDVIAKYDNIMKFIHLPVQSGNDEVLRKMGRRYTREDYLKLVQEMRDKIPGLSLSTDIIVGFPNETEEQFKDTLSLVDIVKYEAAFTFIYSPRKGTPAAKMVDDVDYPTKSRRFKELVAHLEVNIEKDAQKYVGTIQKVLVDGVSKTDDNMLSGYTETNKLVHFHGDKSLVGQIINVKILESHTYSLIGERVDG